VGSSGVNSYFQAVVGGDGEVGVIGLAIGSNDVDGCFNSGLVGWNFGAEVNIRWCGVRSCGI
jgi:hypothetical protein